MKFNGWTLLSLVLLVLGVAFYAWMGVAYQRWSDRGVYSVTVVFVGLGLLGTFVSLAEPRAA